MPLSMAWMYAPMVLAGAVTAVQALAELVDVCARGRDASPLASGEVE